MIYKDILYNSQLAAVFSEWDSLKSFYFQIQENQRFYMYLKWPVVFTNKTGPFVSVCLVQVVFVVKEHFKLSCFHTLFLLSLQQLQTKVFMKVVSTKVYLPKHENISLNWNFYTDEIAVNYFYISFKSSFIFLSLKRNIFHKILIHPGHGPAWKVQFRELDVMFSLCFF